MVRKGQMVYFYPTGQVRYEDAMPALVIQHSRCMTVAHLKVIRCGEDEVKFDVKHDTHPSLVQFPHHRREAGVWTTIEQCPIDHQDTRRNGASKSAKKPAPVPAAVVQHEDDIRKLAADGLTAQQIAARLQGVSSDQVKAVLQ